MVNVTVKLPRVLLFDVIENDADPPVVMFAEAGEIVRFEGPAAETAPLPPPNLTLTPPEPPFLCTESDDGETVGTQGVGVGVAPGV